MIDPLRPGDTDEEPWEIEEQVRQQLGRDLALAVIAGIVIVAILVWMRLR